MTFAQWQASRGIVPWTVVHGIRRVVEVMDAVQPFLVALGEMFVRIGEEAARVAAVFGEAFATMGAAADG